MFEIIDVEKWERREVYEHFSRMKMPHYAVAGNIDVTPLLQHVRQQGISFYLSFIYLSTAVLNDIPNFRMRIVNGSPVKYDKIHVNFTHKTTESELFRYYTCLFEGSMEEFARKTSAAIKEQTTLFGGLSPIPNVTYFSCLPWVDATAILNPGLEDADDAIPRINWGKYVEHNGRFILNVTVTANHRFIDGYHIGKYFEGLQDAIDNSSFFCFKK